VFFDAPTVAWGPEYLDPESLNMPYKPHDVSIFLVKTPCGEAPPPPNFGNCVYGRISSIFIIELALQTRSKLITFTVFTFLADFIDVGRF